MVQKQGKGMVMKKKKKKKVIDDECESNSVAYCQGWSVILKGNQSECVIWNAASRKRIQLPRLNKCPSSFSKCILTSPPTDQLCTVVFFADKTPCLVYCRVFADREWTKHTYSSYQESIWIDAIVFNKKLYAIDLDRCIDEIVIGKKQVTFEQCEDHLRLPCYLPERMQFVESDNELFVVMILSQSRLEVLKLDFSLNQFVNIDSLGDRVFLLSDRYSGSVSGKKLGIKGNRIYITEDNNKSLCVFDFEDATLSLTANRPDSTTDLWFSLEGMMPVLRIAKNLTNQEQQIVEEDGASHSNKKSVEENEGVDIKETFLGKLPMHIQQRIAQCLYQGRDYMNFRVVCRSLRILAPPCRWRCAYSTRTNIQYPWLMSIQRQDGTCNFYDPMDNVTYSMYNLELSNCVIRFSKDGWLLLSKGPRSMFLYEPFAKRRIEVPDLPNDYSFNGVCFSGSPTTSSTPTIIGVSHTSSTWLHICYFDPRNNVWTEFHYDNNDNISFKPAWNNPVFLNGSFYFLSKDGRLGIFELRDGLGPSWRIRSNPKPIWSQSTMCRSYLMAFEEELFSVFVGKEGGELVKVFRLELWSGNWTEVKNLGNQILFVCETTSLAIEAHDERMKNKIYFTSFSKIDNYHVFYSLKTQKYHTFGGGGNDNKRLYDTTERMHKTWIQPRLVPNFDWPYVA